MGRLHGAFKSPELERRAVDSGPATWYVDFLNLKAVRTVLNWRGRHHDGMSEFRTMLVRPMVVGLTGGVVDVVLLACDCLAVGGCEPRNARGVNDQCPE